MITIHANFDIARNVPTIHASKRNIIANKSCFNFRHLYTILINANITLVGLWIINTITQGVLIILLTFDVRVISFRYNSSIGKVKSTNKNHIILFGFFYSYTEKDTITFYCITILLYFCNQLNVMLSMY